LAPQYESPERDKLGWEDLPRISATSCGEGDVATDGSVEVRTGGGLWGLEWGGHRQRRSQVPGGIREHQGL